MVSTTGNKHLCHQMMPQGPIPQPTGCVRLVAGLLLFPFPSLSFRSCLLLWRSQVASWYICRCHPLGWACRGAARTHGTAALVGHGAQAHAVQPQLGGRQVALQLGGLRGQLAQEASRPRLQRGTLPPAPSHWVQRFRVWGFGVLPGALNPAPLQCTRIDGRTRIGQGWQGSAALDALRERRDAVLLSLVQ